MVLLAWRKGASVIARVTISVMVGNRRLQLAT
jgi:hypothetical protein